MFNCLNLRLNFYNDGRFALWTGCPMTECRPLFVAGNIAGGFDHRKRAMSRILSKKQTNSVQHCVKSVCIQSYSGPYFPAFGLNTDQNNSEYKQFLHSTKKSFPTRISSVNMTKLEEKWRSHFLKKSLIKFLAQCKFKLSLRKLCCANAPLIYFGEIIWQKNKFLRFAKRFK